MRDDVPHVFSTETEGCWAPCAGYVFNDINDIRKGVHWHIGLHHPTVPHAYTSEEEGYWKTDPGYVFSINDISCLQGVGMCYANGYDAQKGTHWKYGMIHPTNLELMSGISEGEWVRVPSPASSNSKDNRDSFDLFQWELNWPSPF